MGRLHTTLIIVAMAMCHWHVALSQQTYANNWEKAFEYIGASFGEDFDVHFDASSVEAQTQLIESAAILQSIQEIVVDSEATHQVGEAPAYTDVWHYELVIEGVLTTAGLLELLKNIQRIAEQKTRSVSSGIFSNSSYPNVSLSVTKSQIPAVAKDVTCNLEIDAELNEDEFQTILNHAVQLGHNMEDEFLLKLARSKDRSVDNRRNFVALHTEVRGTAVLAFAADYIASLVTLNAAENINARLFHDAPSTSEANINAWIVEGAAQTVVDPNMGGATPLVRLFRTIAQIQDEIIDDQLTIDLSVQSGDRTFHF